MAAPDPVGCISPCARFGTDRYCCRGPFAAHCSPARTWPVDYAKVFKRAEPFAYSWSGDDATSVFTCKGGCDYEIVFGVSPPVADRRPAALTLARADGRGAAVRAAGRLAVRGAVPGVSLAARAGCGRLPRDARDARAFCEGNAVRDAVSGTSPGSSPLPSAPTRCVDGHATDHASSAC